MRAPLLIVLASAVAAAQPKPGTILDDLADTRTFEEVAISPDGRRVAWVEKVIDKGRDTGRAAVFEVPADGKRPAVKLGEGRHISWSHDGTRLAYVDTQLVVATLGAGTKKLTNLERLWHGDEGIHTGIFGNYSTSRDGRIAAVIRSDWEHPPEIWAGPIGAWKQVTTVDASHRALWGQARSIAWKSDGFSVQGWLLYPRDFDAAKRYPMIVSPHGGPASVTTPRWPQPRFDPTIFSALGYFVFLPNARGSYGQGDAFTRANVKDFGGGDLRDILAGVDAALKMAPIDPDRLGFTGWSYGGYMTMWTVTQTNRFKAAVAGAGIANWLSYYGQNAIDQWMIPYFGASVYEDPAVYARSAPISFVKRVKTPTLIVVGERDVECPPPQSYELWHALKTLGVPTELVVYPGEGHMFRDSAHKRDVLERAAAWFEKYLR